MTQTDHDDVATPGAESNEPSCLDRGSNGPAGFEPRVVSQAFGSQKLSAFALALESWRRGLTVRIETPTAVKFTVTDGTRRVSFNGSRSSATTREAIRTVDNKHKTLRRMSEAQVPVPKSRLFRTSKTSFEDLLSEAERDYQWPVVVKPVRGSQGHGVFANITSETELREAYEYLKENLEVERLLLEEHAHGDDYRVYVVGETVVGACRRIPANVTGDGHSTVRQLVRAKNELRKENPFLSKGLIRRDIEIDNMLSRQGLNYQSVPGLGQYVQLRQKANASAGGDVEDVTDELPQPVRDAAASAVRSIDGLAAAGVDVLMNSKAEEPSESFVIIELNARAHIGVNMYPTHGKGVNAPKAIIDHFFPSTTGESGRAKETLSLNLDALLQPLKDGAASAVEIARVPDHMYPLRRQMTFEHTVHPTAEQSSRILLASRRLEISGALEQRPGSTRLVVAGEEPNVSTFLARVESIVGTTLSEASDWGGTVLMGFYFSEDPLLREH